MRDTTNALNARATLAHAWRAFKAHRGMTMLGVFALVISAVVPFWPLRVAVLSYAQYELTYQSLADDYLLPHDYRRRLLAVIGVQLVVAVIVFAGLWLLVLPGLYLALRLFLAVPALISEDATVFAAIAISWRRTAGQELVLLAIFVAAIAPASALWIAFVVVAANDLGVVPIVATAIAALVVTALTFVFGWFVAAAAYAEGGGGSARLAEIFA